MAIIKASHTSEYTPMPQQAEVTTTKPAEIGSARNGNLRNIVTTQTYVDAATAQVKKCERYKASLNKDALDKTGLITPSQDKELLGLDMGEEGCTRGDEQRCGWGPFSPGMCQRFRDPKWICFWLSWAGAIQGMVVNGFVNVVISNIEKRYDLSSTESGTIASCYDIASVLCLIPVSYFGGLGCKPRYLAWGVFVMGIGSIVFSLPQFASEMYVVGNSGVRTTCDLSANSTFECNADTAPASLSNFKYVFFLGQLLHGAGAAPLYTLGVTYLDENLPLRSSSFYIGIFYALAIVGPAIGYLAGGAFLNLYVDLNRVDMDSVTLAPDNPRWVGAWWIGFLISAALAFIVAIPIGGFPKSLPGSEKYKLEREKEVYSKKTNKGADVDKGFDVEHEHHEIVPHAEKDEDPGIGYKQILKSVKVLVSNPTFMFLNLAAACEGNLLSGIATFMPKFIEAQFALSASTAAQYVGYAAIPAGGGGTFLGGYIVKRFDLHVKGIIRLCLCLTGSVLFLAFVFFVHCGDIPFAGVNIEYGNTAVNSTVSSVGLNLDASCNRGCQCSLDVYDPVCGVDGVLYYSPCYAGCQSEDIAEKKMYSNCSCVVFAGNRSRLEYEAIEGKCASSCKYLPLFMPVCALLMLLTFTASMPALSATLRCIPQDQRSFGLGIQWIIARCLGSIPGPILFGKLIDITCDLWQNRCGEQGSCFSYDNKQMSHNMLAVILSGKFLSTIFFFIAYILYKVPKSEQSKRDDGVNGTESRVANGNISDCSPDISRDDSPPPPTPISLNFSPSATLKSNQSVHTAVTMLSDSAPTTPASPNGQSSPSSWSQL